MGTVQIINLLSHGMTREKNLNEEESFCVFLLCLGSRNGQKGTNGDVSPLSILYYCLI